MSPERRDPVEWIYRLLLRLYPRRFRREYQNDLVQAYRYRKAEPRFRGPLGQIRLLGYLTRDLACSLPLTYRSRGPRFANTDPSPHRGTVMADLLQDLRFALRAYLRRPGFLLACTLTLSLGVGAGTAAFSIADRVILRPLPYPDADRLVAVGPVYEGREGPGPTAPADFFDWQERARSLELLAASRLERLTLLADGEPLALSGAGVSAEYFELLRVEPFLGRAFGRDEDRPGATPVAVLGHGLWERRFGGDPSVLGRTLAMDERRFTVVGVMPPDFHPPEAIYHGDVVVWYPLAHVREDLGQRSAAFLQVVGRLDDDSTPATAASELQRIISAAREAEGADPITAGVAPLREVTVGDVGATLVVLLGAVGFLLVLTCANVANLVLVRATERDREMALRTALGAERSRLVRQLVTEGVLLAVGGGVLAVAIAHGSLEVFKATHPGDLPRLAEMVIDLRVLAFALALSVATGVVFGLVPLARTRIDRLSGSLRAGAPSISRGRRTHRLGSALVVVQTAIATILLAGAGLLTNSFLRLHRVDPGFEPDNAVWLHVSVPSDVYATPEQRLAFFGEVESRLESVPGVASVGGTENLPMGRNRSLAWVSPEGLTLPTGEDPPVVSLNRITPDYFDAIGTSLLGGRSFALTDDLESPPVVVVNRALAQRFWPGREPLGRRVRLGPPDGDEPLREVVGVVENLRQQSVATAPEPELYIPWRQAPRTNLSFVVRGPAADADLLPALLEGVWAVDATIPIARRGTLEGQMRASVVEPRFYTLLLSAFAGLALVLALVGLYGTMAYTVERRTHELGVKMALGAGRRRILLEVLRKGALLLAAGLTVGLVGAAVTTRFLESFVFGVTPGDPVTLSAAAAALGLAGLLSCWLPARRATRLDPVRALRTD